MTVWVVQQMGHCEKGVIEDAGRVRPVLSADQQHALQQRHKLSPVSLLRLHIVGVKAQDQVHLMKPEQKVRLGPCVNWIVSQDGWTHVCDVVNAAEDVFSSLFGFEPSLFLMLFCGLRKDGNIYRMDICSDTDSPILHFLGFFPGLKAFQGCRS